jgi:hypothetical protein
MDDLMKSVKRRGEEGEESVRKLLEEREQENARLRAVVEEYKNNSSSLKVRSLSIGLMVVSWRSCCSATRRI